MYDRSEMIQVLRTEIDRALRAKCDEIWPLGDEFTTEVAFGELAKIRRFRVSEAYDDPGMYRLYADTSHKTALIGSEKMPMSMVEYYKDLLRDIAKMDAAHSVIFRLLDDIEAGRIDIGLTGLGTEFVTFAVYPSEHEQIMIDNMTESGLPVREFEGFGDIIEWIDSIYLATATGDPNKVKPEFDDIPHPGAFDLTSMFGEHGLGDLMAAVSQIVGPYVDTDSHPNAAAWDNIIAAQRGGYQDFGTEAEVIRAILSTLGQEEQTEGDSLERYREEGARIFDELSQGPVGYFAGLSREEQDEAIDAMPTSGPVPSEPVPENSVFIQAVLRDGATLEFRDGKVTIWEEDGTVQTYAIR